MVDAEEMPRWVMACFRELHHELHPARHEPFHACDREHAAGNARRSAKRLEYSLPKTSLVWDGEAFPDDSSGYVRARGENFELEVVASRIGRGVSMTAQEGLLEGLDSENFGTLIEQLRAAVEKADQYEKAAMIPDAQGLSDKARHAVIASEKPSAN